MPSPDLRCCGISVANTGADGENRTDSRTGRMTAMTPCCVKWHLDVNSFLPQLTPREQEFFHHVLLGNNGHHLQISAPNAWQLKHRIRKKLLEFLEIS